MSHTESKELIQAKKLIDVSKLDEADHIIKNFEEKGGLTLRDIVFCHFLKCKLLSERGLNEDVVKLAEKTLKESSGLERNLLLVDILLEMALALLRIAKVDKAFEIIKQGEDLLKTLTQELSTEYKQREAYTALLKGWAYDQKSDIDQAIKQFELSLSLREELGNKNEIAQTLVGIAHMCIKRGEFDRALKSLEQGVVLAEEGGNKGILGQYLYYMGRVHTFKVDFDRSSMYINRSLAIYNNLNNKFMISRNLDTLGEIYMIKGEIDNSIRFYEQSLELLKEINNKLIMSDVYNSLAFCYKMKGELNRALECIKQAMALTNELGTYNPYNNHFLVQIFIDKGNLEQAQISLLEFEQLNSQYKSRFINSMYLLDKALLLKTSPRALNRGKAEEILKQLLEDGNLYYDINLEVLLNLCELLLTDLKVTNETEILEEIKPLIIQLLDFSEKSLSFWVFGETCLLQAKLALIELNLEEARRLMTKGQQIAEKYGLIQLAIKISNEHDQMLKKLELWEKIKASKAPLAERIELSRLNEQMEGMVKSRIDKIPKLVAEQPVLLTIMSRQGSILLSNPFTADVKIDSTFFSEFLSSCNTFCDQVLSESFDRVKFGQHTVLITAIDSFSVCYMFQGQTYSARQKLLHFSDAIRKEPEIMNKLKDANSKNIEINVNETASLEESIYESFLSDSEQFQMPFKAYEGDESFIFVSYSHTDRLQVYPIIDYLNKTGINVWYDEGIHVSEDWKNIIADNLERCSAFLIFITPHIIDSVTVNKEISFALKKQKPFFSIYLKETQLPSKLEFEIGDIQHMKKYLMSETEFYNKLNSLFGRVLKK